MPGARRPPFVVRRHAYEALIPVGPCGRRQAPRLTFGGPTTRSESRLSEPDPRAAANSAEASSRWTALRSLRNPLPSWWSMPGASDRGRVSFRKRPNFGWSGQNPTHPRSRQMRDTGRPEHPLARDTPYYSSSTGWSLSDCLPFQAVVMRSLEAIDRAARCPPRLSPIGRWNRGAGWGGHTHSGHSHHVPRESRPTPMRWAARRTSAVTSWWIWSSGVAARCFRKLLAWTCQRPRSALAAI